MIIHKSFGLDLGTTNSTASVVLNGKVVFAEEDKIRKNKTIPSFFAISNRKKGEEIIGTLAKNEFYSGNPNSKKSVKRDMGKDISYKYGDVDYTPEVISSKIISYCKECLEKTIKKDESVVYDKVVITVPAYFSLAQKDATRKAGELSGLEVTMLLEEPTSAAINYALQNNVENGLFFVFDLGGGTFDVSILEKTGNVPQVLATAGNNFLGGDNFDLLLARHFLKYLKNAGYDVSDVKADVANSKFKLLMLLAENTKKKLSDEESIEIHYQDIFKDLSCRDLDIEKFTRNDFNKIIKAKIDTDVLVECDKALEILNEKYGKSLEDITHIIMVGGSSKIPYVQEVIKKKYCVTEKLKDITCFEPDLSVSAGAALVSNAQGYTIEDKNIGLLVDVNAPFVVDGQVYISGKMSKGMLDSIGIKTSKREIKTNIEDDGTFMAILNEKEYSDSTSFVFYNEDSTIQNIVNNEDNSTIDIIAPTPVQNETIAVEIIDIEKGQIEKYPIVESGVTLPCESTEYFKINEYSREQVILPIWEGPRKIFDLVIDLPNNAKIGSKLAVTTRVDMISNIELEVKLDGQILNGKYEYVGQKENGRAEFEKLEDAFYERIDYVQDLELKEELIEKKQNIDRELAEASDNNDKNHFTTVSEKFEKIVAEMPSEHVFTEEEFDSIGEEIKAKLSPDINISEYDVDNLVFYGKRFVNKDNQVEARKCMNELKQMRSSVEIFDSPRLFFDTSRLIVAEIISKAVNYTQNKNANPSIVKEINNELDVNLKTINELFEKYGDKDKESEEMRQDAIRLIHITVKLYQIMEKVTPAGDKTMSAFKGLVSKG